MASPSAPTSPMKDNADYILAVEQLARGAFAERRAAADTLVGLADEWLSNATISAAERDAAAQVVADALCAYIRTPLMPEQEAENPRNTGENPPEKERSFYHDEGQLNEGAEGALRQHILEAIHQRARWHLNPGEQVGEYETPLQAQTTPGPWSHLVFDFTGAIFCHPVNFSGSHWGRTVSFAGCTFTETADFSSSFYEGEAIFEGSTYRSGAGFVQCVYHQDVRHTGSVYRAGAEFGASTYRGAADFSRVIFYGPADFGVSVFCCGPQHPVNFSCCVFAEAADFSKSCFCSYTDFSTAQWLDGAFFEYCTFYNGTDMRGSSFSGEAVFAEAVFVADANFSDITCEADADFDSCSFYGNYRSDESEYEGAVGFTNALFLGDVDFAGARFTGDAPSFDEAVFAPGVLTRLPHKGQQAEGHQHPDTVPVMKLTQAPAGARLLPTDEAEQAHTLLSAIPHQIAAVQGREGENMNFLTVSDELRVATESLWEWSQQVRDGE